MNVNLTVVGIAKRFGYREVFENIDFSLKSGGALGITGYNGSGKTTLIKIIAGLLHQSKGEITLTDNGVVIKNESYTDYIKLVSPEMALYETLTAFENLKFFARVSGIKSEQSRFEQLLDRVGLAARGYDRVATYSSGMKQRLKYAVALLAEPVVLLLDEPNNNLDDSGRVMVRELMAQHKDDGILIIATNEAEDLANVGQVIELGK